MDSATDWKHYYFLGCTPRDLSQVMLSQAHIQALLSMVNVSSGITTNFMTDPRLVINEECITVWLALYAFLATVHPEDLKAAQKQEAILFSPAELLNRSFGKHNNWPKAMLQKYELDFPGIHLFIIPFLVSASGAAPDEMMRSLKTPDGMLEIIGVHEFPENDPESLLGNSDAALKWYRNEHSI